MSTWFPCPNNAPGEAMQPDNIPKEEIRCILRRFIRIGMDQMHHPRRSIRNFQHTVKHSTFVRNVRKSNNPIHTGRLQLPGGQGQGIGAKVVGQPSPADTSNKSLRTLPLTPSCAEKILSRHKIIQLPHTPMIDSIYSMRRLCSLTHLKGGGHICRTGVERLSEELFSPPLLVLP